MDDASHQFLERDPSARATFIALIGIDGAGKTTQTRLLREALSGFGMDVTLAPNEDLAPLVARLDASARAQGFKDHASLFGPDVAGLIAACVKWQGLWRLRRQLSRAEAPSVIIADRYAYCQIAAANARQYPYPVFANELFGSFPAPDLTLLLQISPDVAASRERSRGGITHTPEFLASFAAAYTCLADAASFVPIDASGSPEQVHRLVLDAVLRHCETIDSYRQASDRAGG